jgi:hypothetical protein
MRRSFDRRQRALLDRLTGAAQTRARNIILI